MGNFLTHNFKWLLLAGGAALTLWKGKQLLGDAQDATKEVTKPIADALYPIFYNDNDGVTYPRAGFFVNPDKLDENYKVKNSDWLRALRTTHPENRKLIDEMFDLNEVLAPVYRVLVGQIATPKAVAAARTGGGL